MISKEALQYIITNWLQPKIDEVVGISPEVTEGMGWVLNGEGIATVKIDVGFTW